MARKQSEKRTGLQATHPEGTRTERRTKKRFNNKKHTKARLKYWYGVTSNVMKRVYKEKKKVIWFSRLTAYWLWA